MYDDPYSAYWFYVQTGGAARESRAYDASNVTLNDAAFTVRALRRISRAEAIAFVDASRIPDWFIEEHEALEQALTDVVLTREETLRTLSTMGLTARAEGRLRGYIKDPKESDVISTIDLNRMAELGKPESQAIVGE